MAGTEFGVIMSRPNPARPNPANENREPSNAERVYHVSEADVPLSCPTPAMHLWDSHPRVYLPIEAGGEAKCPYCGAVYRWAA